MLLSPIPHSESDRWHVTLTHTKRLLKKDTLNIPRQSHAVATRTKTGRSQQVYSNTKQKERKATISGELAHIYMRADLIKYKLSVR